MAKPNSEVLLGGVEAGGTSFVVTVAKGSPTNIIDRHRIQTTTPQETLGKAVAWLKSKKVAAVGVASFGPVDADPKSKTYGYITSTPKPNWPNTDVLGQFKTLGVPLGFNTDVQAAAIGELKHGQHGNITSCCYITVGTGVGVGVVTDKHAVYGLTHPEGGHIRVARHPKDTYKGNCPYHGDCVEGLTNARAVADRAGVTPAQTKDLPIDNEVFDFVAYYIGQLCANLVLIVSPEVIVLGGGVLQRRAMFPKIRKHVQNLLNGYVQMKKITHDIDKYIVSSVADHGPDNNAGSVGALELARIALDEAQKKPRARL